MAAWAAARRAMGTRKGEQASGTDLNYQVGNMIEIPRAAMTADDIAPHSDFFS